MVDTEELLEVETVWRGLAGDVPTPGENSDKQKSWDLPLAKVARERLLDGVDQVGWACLLAAACGESGAWLNAIPVPSLGTHLDPDVLRIAVALRIGSLVCEPHTCRCGLWRVNG